MTATTLARTDPGPMAKAEPNMVDADTPEPLDAKLTGLAS